MGARKWVLNLPSGVFSLGFGFVSKDGSKVDSDFAGLRGDRDVRVYRATANKRCLFKMPTANESCFFILLQKRTEKWRELKSNFFLSLSLICDMV